LGSSKQTAAAESKQITLQSNLSLCWNGVLQVAQMSLGLNKLKGKYKSKGKY
jgi:hypothetical protein